MGKRFVLHALALALALVALFPGGCGEPEQPTAVEPAGTGETRVIAVAQLTQETNIFSPVATTLHDFEAAGLLYGSEMLLADELSGELAGFMKAVEDLGNGDIEVVPIFRARSMSGGPIEAAVYERFKQELLEGLREIESLDGLYLILHGAMGVEGLIDPEGDLLQAIRDELGDELPIGISYDLHANVTEANAQLATFIVGYQTNPHRDQFATGYTAGEILIKTVREEVQPVMAFRKMKLLIGGGMTIDFLPPMNKIFKWMEQVQEQPEVLAISNYMVHIWLDEPELGWSTVVVTDGDPGLAAALAEELADRNWTVRDYAQPEGYTPSEAIALARSKWLARKLGTVMFCDVSDAVGAGAPGENTWILKALLEEGSDLISYIPLRDGKAAREAYSVPVGETITVEVGGKLEQTYNQPVEVTGRVIRKVDGLYGQTVILQSDGVHLVLTELPPAAMSPDFYTDLELNLWQADIVVAKNLFPFRIWFLLYNRQTIDVVTPGTTNVNVFELEYKQIPRPIYPFDDLEDWR
jgi:microcystin degradation protein MlrC